jgi:hypothetical protein
VRKYRTDYRLWGLISGALFVPPWAFLAAVELADRRVHLRTDLAGQYAGVTLFLAAAAASVGWLAQAIDVMQGGRPPERRPDPQASDYDDAPPPASPAP